MAVAALVLGIIGALLSLTGVLSFVGIPLALFGTILGIVSRKTAVTNNEPTGAATAGMVLGIFGVVVGIALWVLCNMMAMSAKNAVYDFAKKMNDPEIRTKNDNDSPDEASKKAKEDAKGREPKQPSSGERNK